MAPENPPASSTAEDVAQFDHWIYAVVPQVGYTTRGMSRGFDAGLFDPYLRGHYTPIRAAAAQDIDGEIDLRMFHPVRTGREFLLSRITRGVPDEAGRPTFTNHTVVVRVDLLKSGRVTLEDTFRSMARFGVKFPGAEGRLDLLQVPMRPESDAPPRFGEGIHKHLTFAALETLATRFMRDATSRTLLLCRNSTAEARNATLTLLVELLAFKCNLPLFPAISDAPRSSALNHFNLVIAQRGVRADASWAILESALTEHVLPRVPDREEIYRALSAAVRQSADGARAV
ncbi:MAG TPA: hypothetical protein VEY12_05085 [Thermoplasmata archaeon]|nr:hypothetical protein [Thermoplasmata archaeon]